MNRRLTLSIVAALTGLGLTPTPGHADSSQLSPERLDKLDQMGYFTPGFKMAIHDLVNAKQALEQAKAEKTKLSQELPDLQKQATETEAKATTFRQELAKYDHPEETDFVPLQQQMNDPRVKLEERIVLAQAYVWTYPASPHESEAQQYLQQTQKRLAEEQQAIKDAESVRVAAYAKLVQRAQAKDLNLGEWKNFLSDMSQDDLLKLLGRPTSQAGDYWIYTGNWITDPITRQKVGLVINFNAGRVLSVSEPPRSQ